jgi:hypothetical protein
MSPETEIVLMLGLFALGTVLGLLSGKIALSGWLALTLPLVIPPVGVALTAMFC